MKVSDCVQCKTFPCHDVKHECYIVPQIDVVPEQISIIMISEVAPTTPNDYYYARGNPLFQQTTVLAFQDAGINVSTTQEILELGVYMTTAVKCGKTGYGLRASTIEECSRLLERELEFFPNLKVIMLMGDVAIKAINYIAKRNKESRVIPAGSTYRIRNREYLFRSMKVFPSYLQAGSSFFIEKSKRKMITEDIATAVTYIKKGETLTNNKMSGS